MKNLMNFYASMWLLVLGLTFGLWGCETSQDATLGRPNIPENNATYGFAITDMDGYNLIPTEETGIYEMRFIHLIMHDGTVVKDFEYSFNPTYHHPAVRGCVFDSKFLGKVIRWKGYREDYRKREYADKDFYLVLSEEDTDTLRWNSSEGQLYHNGKIAVGGYMIMKQID